jgi:hypothetical protein
LAKIGRVNSEVKFNIAPVSKEHEKFRTEVIKNPPEGYWKTVTDRNPMLHHTWMYFNTRATSQVRGEYYTATRGEDEDFPGKMESDAAYAVIKLSKPVEVLEQLRKYQTEITGDHDSVIVANLVNLFTKDRANDLETFGAATLVRHHPRKADLTFIDKTPITQEKNPPLLALRVIEATSDLKARLIDFESGNLAGYTYIEKEEDDLTPATRENLSLEELKKSWIARANTPCIFLSALAKTNLEKFRSDLYGMVREIHAGRYPFNNFLY